MLPLGVLNVLNAPKKVEGGQPVRRSKSFGSVTLDGQYEVDVSFVEGTALSPISRQADVDRPK